MNKKSLFLEKQEKDKNYKATERHKANKWFDMHESGFNYSNLSRLLWWKSWKCNRKILLVPQSSLIIIIFLHRKTVLILILIITLTLRSKFFTLLLHNLVLKLVANTGRGLDSRTLSLIDGEKLMKKVFIGSHGRLQDFQFNPLPLQRTQHLLRHLIHIQRP